MAVRMTITGNGKIAGGPTNVVSYSADEEATPVDPTSSRGGVGGVQITAVESERADGSVLLIGDLVDLEDGSTGTTQAIVSGIQTVSGALTIDLESRLSLLVVNRQANPFSGTLEGAIRYYLELVGITSKVVIDPAIGSKIVVFPGWYGDVWLHMKMMGIAQGFEIALVSDNLVFRAVRLREAMAYRDSALTASLNTDSTALSVEGYLYNNVAKSDSLVWPVGGWTPATQIWQVDAGETQEFDLPLSASLSSVSQPTCVSDVPRAYAGTASVYTVIDKNKALVNPATWTSTGGSVEVVINEDTTSVTVRVTGGGNANLQPYRIAMPIGGSGASEGDAYASTRIVGTGVFFDKVKVSVPTSADLERTTQEVGATIDNPFLGTPQLLWDALHRAAARFSGPAQTIRVSTVGINRIGVSGSADYFSFGDFDEATPALTTFAEFDAELDFGSTYADFDEHIQSLTVEQFKSQAFGNVAGARRRYRYSMYRIDSATISEDEVRYSAEEDTLYSDFEDVWPDGSTFADFDNVWDNKTYGDFNPIPLWRGEVNHAD